MRNTKSFIESVFMIAKEHGYKVETNRDGLRQVNFGNKKLHEKHLADMWPDIVNPGADLPLIIEKVAPGSQCTHRPMEKIVAQLKSEWEKYGISGKVTFDELLTDNKLLPGFITFAVLIVFFLFIFGKMVSCAVREPTIEEQLSEGCKNRCAMTSVVCGNFCRETSFNEYQEDRCNEKCTQAHLKCQRQCD